MTPTYVARAPTPPFLRRRKLRAAYINALGCYKTCSAWLSFNRDCPDAWTALQIGRLTLEQARQEYLDCAGIGTTH